MLRTVFFVFSILYVTAVWGQRGKTENDTILNYTDINGMKQGRWEKYNLNKVKIFEAYFIDNKPIGDLKRYDNSGNLYAHLVYDTNGENARAIFYEKDGSILATGNYCGKDKDSVWTFYTNKKKISHQESYNCGIKNGFFRMYNIDGKLVEESNWKNGKKDGVYKKFYQSGSPLMEATYVEGKLHGTSKSFYSSGIVMLEGQYINDVQDGKWIRHARNGTIEKVYVFEKGKCDQLDEEQNEMLNEFEKLKGQFEDPAEHSNDIEFFMKGNR